jgi:hypothetical protein
VKTYDPKKFDIVFAGRHLNEGVADGTFLTLAGSTPAFSKKVSVDGPVTRTRSHDRSGTARLVIMQTSEVNDILSAILAGDRAATNGLGVGAFFVQDRSGTTVATASKAYIADDPDLTLDATATTREWVFELADLELFHGSNSDD